MSGGHWKIRLGRGRRVAGEGEPGPGARLAGRLLGTLFFGFFLGMGLLFVALIGHETWRAAETFGWEERRCEITRSEVIRAGGEEPYRPAVRYRTIDGGESVAGGPVRRGGLGFDRWDQAARHLAAYPVGATVACWVSPAREAVLERGPLAFGLWGLLPLVFVAIGGAGLVSAWWPERRDRLGRPVPEPLAARAGRSRAGRGMLAAGVFVGAIGLVALWFLAIVPLARVHAARSWVPTTCTVEHSSVVSHDDDEGTTYSVDILYRWDRGRGVERSSRYSFFGGSSSGYDAKAEIVRAHPVGAEVDCWVHPGRRHEAVLERGLTPFALAGLVPVVFLAAGVGLALAGRRKLARRSRMRDEAASGRSPFAPDDPLLEVLPHFEWRPGPVALKARSTRWGRLLGLVFMTLFWNGIVGVFVHEAWKGWERGRPDWILTIFLVPFVLVGAGLFVGILHSLLALANAQPRLLASTRTPRLGERVELRWGFRGAAGRLESVRIALKGREEATYRVGTETRTASEDFFEQVAVDVPAPLASAGGHATLLVPGDSMHSFESEHNKIVWELELRGAIRRWPDVSETYPLVVLPRAPDQRKPEER